ncbi:hypothetical protein GQ43DRAFT_49297 [Delitschia confertaspora ATCC 74209]|uniref:Uncharacterized protein n=1 Tax=Delitschia confertaspora ATCC 74209 TaxID=1513339 RepID=A0A9P4JMJ8_9PLEO|nr:hypothetical protein GQ43DRAFT_49297 [Delitschia confertaspora ATCC 74209]
MFNCWSEFARCKCYFACCLLPCASPNLLVYLSITLNSWFPSSPSTLSTDISPRLDSQPAQAPYPSSVESTVRPFTVRGFSCLTSFRRYVVLCEPQFKTLYPPPSSLPTHHVAAVPFFS